MNRGVLTRSSFCPKFDHFWLQKTQDGDAATEIAEQHPNPAKTASLLIKEESRGCICCEVTDDRSDLTDNINVSISYSSHPRGSYSPPPCSSDANLSQQVIVESAIPHWKTRHWIPRSSRFPDVLTDGSTIKWRGNRIQSSVGLLPAHALNWQAVILIPLHALLCGSHVSRDCF